MKHVIRKQLLKFTSKKVEMIQKGLEFLAFGDHDVVFNSLSLYGNKV